MRLLPLSLAVLTLVATARAQSGYDAGDARVADAIARWIALPAPPGAEELALGQLAPVLPGWSRDASGNLIRRVGHGMPRRVVACGLDVPAYVVSEITADGYVRLHRDGSAPVHPLWDQFHEAQRGRIFTRTGSVPGEIAVANGHFARQHRGDTAVVTADQLWVDVGASSRVDAERLGLALLDPVVLDRPAWSFAGEAAGPGAGARAGCAAVATAATGLVASGETVFIISAQRSFAWTGLRAALRRLGTVESLAVVGAGRARTSGDRVTAVPPNPRAGDPPRGLASGAEQLLAAPVRFAGSLVESVSAASAESLLTAVASAADVTLPPGTAWVAPTPIVDAARRPRTDGLEDADHELASLLDIPAVPGHEWRMRDAVRAALPAWAKQRAVTDSAGNLIVAFGPDRDSVLFIAHLDEVSFEVERIFGDGTVSLVRKGGPVVTAWEGQPALLDFDREPDGHVASPLRGVFVPRDSARVKAPSRMTAWFGVDSAALVALGVHTGSAVTGYKHAQRLAGARITGRAMDDRAGCTALLLALRRLDPSTLRHKVLFVWSTAEETGLVGARALGARIGPSLRRVYSLDTFVSSDTPLEKPNFAFAPLGAGAVLRGLDDGSVTPRAERERVERIARAAGIPLQTGTTQGATDGSSIAPFGPPNVGLSWPGRYSHSPAEVLDLRDVDALARLIAAVAVAP